MYFGNFNLVDYKFGNEDYTVQFQQNNIYIDLLDQIKDDVAYYQKYEIQGDERPDSLSYRLYGSEKFYWTFFLMNDSLRLQGWPMSVRDTEDMVKEVYSNTVLTTQSEIFDTFKVGDVVSGLTSGQRGTIIKRRLDFGQLIIEGEKSFGSDEIITTPGEDDTLNSTQLVSSVEEYNSVDHYVDGDNNPVDVDPFSDPPQLYTPVTILDRYQNTAAELRSIKILKPNVVNQIYSNFQKLVTQA